MDSADPQLKMLFDYTIFHIGLYSTLVSALFALMTFGKKHDQVKLRLKFLKATVVCFLVAGAAGGAIASNLPLQKTFEEYSKPGTLNVFGLPASFEFCSHLEHLAFWAGIAVAAWGLLRE